MSLEIDKQVNLELSINAFRIATENFITDNSFVTSGLGNVLHALKERANTTFTGFTGLTNDFKKIIDGFFLNLKLKDLEKLNYVGLSTSLITVPEGFDGNLAAYSYDCVEIYKRIMPASFSYLNELNIQLGRIVTNKEEKTSVKSYEDLYKNYEKLRVDSENILYKYFNKSTNSKLPLGKVLNNKNEIIELVNNNKMLESLIKGTNVKGIVDNINETYDYINEINKQIKENPSIRLSPQVIQLLSEGLYEAAKYFEFLSELFYDCDVLVNITNELLKTIKKNMSPTVLKDGASR